MSWVLASLIAAFFLGVFDLCNKHAVQNNAVLPVLFCSTGVSGTMWGALVIVERMAPGTLPAAFVVPPLSPGEHAHIFVKSAIVASSWICTYFAVKHLALSIAGPIRAMQPLVTLSGALLVFGERPSWVQGAGIAVTLTAFVGLSLIGRREGVHFHRDKWVGYMFAGMLLGAVSSLYDRYLFGQLHYSVPAVQAWFSIYLLALMVPLVVGWHQRWWPRNPFTWRWSIPVIGLALLVSDYLYFGALTDPDALVSLVSSLRRGSVLVSFAGSVLLFGEPNAVAKLPAVLGILAGITLIALG